MHELTKKKYDKIYKHIVELMFEYEISFEQAVLMIQLRRR